MYYVTEKYKTDITESDIKSFSKNNIEYAEYNIESLYNLFEFILLNRD